MYKILVVEDEKEIRNFIKEALLSQNYQVYEAEHGLEAISIMKKQKIDLLITDVMMPNLDGYALLEAIRQDNNIPIVMLTALTEEYDEMKAFDLGVDEFIKKPFSINIFLRRIKNLLNRYYSVKQNNIIQDDKLKVNKGSYEIFYENKKIETTLKEFQILLYLLNNKDNVISREQIIHEIWGHDYYGDTRNVDTHIKNIRKKIPEINIKTITGIGYSFVSK